MNTRQWLETLVAFDTTSRNSNLELITTVRDSLEKQGISSWLAHTKEQTKANLFATLPATAGPNRPTPAASGKNSGISESCSATAAAASPTAG